MHLDSVCTVQQSPDAHPKAAFPSQLHVDTFLVVIFFLKDKVTDTLKDNLFYCVLWREGLLLDGLAPGVRRKVFCLLINESL